MMHKSLAKSVLAITLSFALASCNYHSDAKRSPTFVYGKETEGGCANVFFHKGSADQLEVLWIDADRKKLSLPDEGSKTFDLADAPDGLLVAVDLWDAVPRFSAYCNDISPDTNHVTWKAIKGKITVTLHAPTGDKEAGPQRYKASARLEGVVFDNETGRQATLAEETITDVEVGWYAG
jgi:hypothetical protein